MSGKSSYSCWFLSPDERERLLTRFPPHFPDLVAHHVTYRFGSNEIPPEATVNVIGVLHDPTGVQVLLVAVDVDGEGRSRTSPDGIVYHLTWSIDRAAGKTAFSSVDSIGRLMDSDCHVEIDPEEIVMEPRVFRRGARY